MFLMCCFDVSVNLSDWKVKVISGVSFGVRFHVFDIVVITASIQRQ